MGGSAQPNASAQVLAGAVLAVPGLGVLSSFADLMAPLDEKIWHNTSRTNTLRQLRDTLLPRLISGKLRVPEAEKLMEAVL